MVAKWELGDEILASQAEFNNQFFRWAYEKDKEDIAQLWKR
jgi:hypothetical protein